MSLMDILHTLLPHHRKPSPPLSSVELELQRQQREMDKVLKLRWSQRDEQIAESERVLERQKRDFEDMVTLASLQLRVDFLAHEGEQASGTDNPTDHL